MRIKDRIRRLVDNAHARRAWVAQRLKELPPGSRILDAGCGAQQYRPLCGHLDYVAQDFGRFSMDQKDSLTASQTPYTYGHLDYVGNIWQIPEQDAAFDAILCTEVLEHIPYPNETLAEFARLLKPGGRLILTVPANSLRHMDPYYYYSGFSDRYLELLLSRSGFRRIRITTAGSYHAWLMVETVRCMRHEGIWALLLLWPAALYHYLKQRSPAPRDVNTLCFGYHATAEKARDSKSC